MEENPVSLVTTTNDSLPSHVFAGSNLGYIKGVNFSKKTYRNLNNIDSKPTRSMGINCLCWSNSDESSFFAGQSGGDIFQYSLITETSHNVNLVQEDGDGQLKSIKTYRKKIMSGFSNGVVKVFDLADKKSVDINPLLTINSFSEGEEKHFECMDHNISVPNTIVTGGNKNCLKVWDINASERPVFTAKNVKNNWLNLQVPVWNTKVQFYPGGDKIVSGTGFGDVRLYDPSSSQRRPVIDVKCGEHPITGFCVRPNSNFQIFVGDTMGLINCVDLRKKANFKSFKGCKGGVTDIVAHPTYPVFTVSSVDRFVYCYDADSSRNCVHSVYLKNSLNCLLLCSSSFEDIVKTMPQKKSEDSSKMELKGASKIIDDEVVSENDDIWDTMEVVGSKKRVVKEKSKGSRTSKPKAKKKSL